MNIICLSATGTRTHQRTAQVMSNMQSGVKQLTDSQSASKASDHRSAAAASGSVARVTKAATNPSLTRRVMIYGRHGSLHSTCGESTANN